MLALITEGQKDMSARAYAAWLGVSPTYLADVYSGRRGPGEGVLKKLGIEKNVRTIVEYWKKE